jgi:hypothetical protein
MKETISTLETSILTRSTHSNIPEDGILHSHRRENIKSYTAIISFSITDRYSVLRKVQNSNLTQQSYPIAKLTDTVCSVRYEPQILHSNHIP